MLELRNVSGESLGRTFGGKTHLEAAHLVFSQYKREGTVAMLPAATAVEGEIALLAFIDDGRVLDTYLRLVGTEG